MSGVWLMVTSTVMSDLKREFKRAGNAVSETRLTEVTAGSLLPIAKNRSPSAGEMPDANRAPLRPLSPNVLLSRERSDAPHAKLEVKHAPTPEYYHVASVTTQSSRVMEFMNGSGSGDANKLLASERRNNNHGLLLIDLATIDQGNSVYIPLHDSALRGISFEPSQDLVLTGSMDKRAALCDMKTQRCIWRHDFDRAVWSCAFNTEDSNYLYCGLQNGSVFLFDLRQRHKQVDTFLAEGSTQPLYSLLYCPSSSQCPGGLLSASAASVCFWDKSRNYLCSQLSTLAGKCVSVSMGVGISGLMLAAFRSADNSPGRHVISFHRAPHLQRRQLLP